MNLNLFICVTDTPAEIVGAEFSLSIEKMIEFGAHSREFIEFVFQNRKEQSLRDNIAKLMQNGMRLADLLDYEQESIKDRTPDEKRDIISGYINGMSSLLDPKEKGWYAKRHPYRFCADLIQNADLDEDMEEDFIICALEWARKLHYMDGPACAEQLFLYRHRDDEDAELDLHDGYTPYTEEVERITDCYFSGIDDYEEFDDDY